MGCDGGVCVHIERRHVNLNLDPFGGKIIPGPRHRVPQTLSSPRLCVDLMAKCVVEKSLRHRCFIGFENLLFFSHGFGPSFIESDIFCSENFYIERFFDDCTV